MSDNLKADLFLLVGYLLTSAHGLFHEPHGYGPFRLMDAAGRLLEVMASNGLSEPFLSDLQATLEDERFGSGDDQHLQAVLDGLCQQYAVELTQRLESEESD
jgi:hypothetical protein